LTEPEIPLAEIVTHAIVNIPLVALMAALDLLADFEDAGRDEARPIYDFLPLAARAGIVRDALRFSNPTAQGRALEELLPAVRARAELAVILSAEHPQPSALQLAVRAAVDADREKPPRIPGPFESFTGRPEFHDVDEFFAAHDAAQREKAAREETAQPPAITVTHRPDLDRPEVTATPALPLALPAPEARALDGVTFAEILGGKCDEDVARAVQLLLRPSLYGGELDENPDAAIAYALGHFAIGRRADRDAAPLSPAMSAPVWAALARWPDCIPTGSGT
jgi:hypothetical protein